MEPTVPPLGGGVPAAWCKITSTPGNRTVSKLPPLTSVPPMARKIFLLAATSRLLRCQCPMVTPASFGGNACAHAVPADKPQNTNNTMIACLIVGSFSVAQKRLENILMINHYLSDLPRQRGDV